LTYLFASSDVPPTLSFTSQEYGLVRAQAATTLKNNIRDGYTKIPQSTIDVIKSSVPLVLSDKESKMRGFAGNVITEILSKGGITAWPEILSQLMDMVSNSNGSISPETQEGAMAALCKICEDHMKALDKDYNGQRPLNVMIPKLIEYTQSPVAKVRAQALTAINIFIPQKPQAILINLDSLLQHLFQLANDSVPDVRRQVCRAFVQIVEVRSDKIQPHIAGLVDYIIAQQQQTEDEDLATDAAEFWLSVGEHTALWQSLTPHLHKIIPVLLESMVYSENDIVQLGGDDDDAEFEDKLEDIAPTFAKSKGMRGEGTNGDGTHTPNENFSNDHEEGEISESDPEDEDDDDELDPMDVWNLRKCSAAALDVFSTDFKSPIFNYILPYLMENLKHHDWPRREAAVLALGAVADGCMDEVTPHLPDLVPYLLSLLNDTEPLVRQITCWTLGRYSSWAVGLNDQNMRQAYFVPMMEGLLVKMLDRNKKVQEAAASAFANLEERAGAQLIPYCQPIIQQFVKCFEKYKDKNMFVLYDCVQTLAEHVGPSLAAPELINLLMPALIQRWKRVSDQSRELFPLLECLSYVAIALNIAFTPFAAPIFARCIKVIHTNLEDHALAAQNPDLDQPDKDFLVTSLDLLSSIIQVLEPAKAIALVQSSQPNFFELLTFCLEDPTSDVRQSSYALLGDCAKFIHPALGPYLSSILPVLLKQLDLHQDAVLKEWETTGYAVANNACWSLGEIAIVHGQAIGPHVEEFLKKLIEILRNKKIPGSVHENAAIALGRLGLENNEAMAPHLALFAGPFLTVMDSVDYTEEKTSAFTGFTLIVARNPQAMEQVLAHFFSSIARYRQEFEYTTSGKLSLNALFAEASNHFPLLATLN
jgi:HEAT repeat protein